MPEEDGVRVSRPVLHVSKFVLLAAHFYLVELAEDAVKGDLRFQGSITLDTD